MINLRYICIVFLECTLCHFMLSGILLHVNLNSLIKECQGVQNVKMLFCQEAIIYWE